MQKDFEIKRLEMLDITAPEYVQVQIRSDGSVLWVHVDGVTVLRICRIEHEIEVNDERTV